MSRYVNCLKAALAEAGYPKAGVFVTNGIVTIGCIPHGMDPASNPDMPPEAVADRAFEVCSALQATTEDGPDTLRWPRWDED